jgi:hypothetical protein
MLQKFFNDTFQKCYKNFREIEDNKIWETWVRFLYNVKFREVERKHFVTTLLYLR